jgi:hypothetical protein
MRICKFYFKTLAILVTLWGAWFLGFWAIWIGEVPKSVGYVSGEGSVWLLTFAFILYAAICLVTGIRLLLSYNKRTAIQLSAVSLISIFLLLLPDIQSMSGAKLAVMVVIVFFIMYSIYKLHYFVINKEKWDQDT